MKKTLKVTQAICPCCHFRKPLENSDHYFQHILLWCKLPSGETVNWICVGSGMKASRFALRQERKRLRDIDTIERRHVEMQRKRQELAAEARMLSQIAASMPMRFVTCWSPTISGHPFRQEESLRFAIWWNAFILKAQILLSKWKTERKPTRACKRLSNRWLTKFSVGNRLCSKSLFWRII